MKLTDANNYNPSPYVQRSSRIAGLETKVRLPSCTLVRATLAAPTLEWLHQMVEDYFHGELHSAVGGAWGSKLDLGTVVADLRRDCEKQRHHNDTVDGTYYSACESIKYIEDFAVNINTFSRAAFFVAHQGSPSTEAWYDCPTYDACQNRSVALGVDVDDVCACGSPELRGDNTSFTTAKNFLEKLGISSSLSDHAGTNIVDDVDDDDAVEAVDLPDSNVTVNTSVSYTNFLHVSDDDAERLWILMADWLANPPRFGPMSATLAAPNDPIFWVIHNTWERMYHKKFLSPKLSKEFTWTWTAAATCWSFELDSILPWSDLVDEDKTNKKTDGARQNDTTTDYTNQQLLDLFDPANPNLPYIYDTLSWEHCAAASEDGTAAAFDHETTAAYEDAKSRKPTTSPGGWPWDAKDALDEDTRRVLRRGATYAKLWVLIDGAARR